MNDGQDAFANVHFKVFTSGRLLAVTADNCFAERMFAHLLGCGGKGVYFVFCATDSCETVTARFHFGVGVEAWREWEQSSRRFQIHDTSGVRLPLAVESSMIITKI